MTLPKLKTPPGDNLSSTLAVPFLHASATTVAFQSIDSGVFGSPTPAAPLRFTLVRPSQQSDPLWAISDRTQSATYTATGGSGSTLTGVAFESGTDQDFEAGSLIAVCVTARDFTDLIAYATAGSGINAFATGELVGDGTTDDGPALNAIIAAYSGREIFLPRRRVSQTVPCYRSSQALAITQPGTHLAGEVAGFSGGTTIGFDPGVGGLDVRSDASGSGAHRLVLWGRSPWLQAFPSQGVLPSGWTGSALANAAAPADDGVRVGASQCTFDRVYAYSFGRHGWNLSNADCSGGLGTSDCCTFTSCYGANNRGYGWYAQGGDSNANSFFMCQASVNQLGGIYDNSFLGNAWFGPKTDENHFDNAQGLVAATQPLASISRASNIVTLTFSAPYTWADNQGGAFVPGQGITIAGMADATYNGTWIVHQVVSSSVVRFSMTGADATPSAVGATARLAKMVESWTKVGPGLICPTGGAFRTSESTASRTTISGLYTEGGQNPAGDPSTPYCAFGSGTTVINPIGDLVDFDYGGPTIIGPVGGIGLPGFYGSFPSCTSPVDLDTQFFQRAGRTADQNVIRVHQKFDGSDVLWTEIEGSIYRDLYSGRTTAGAPLVMRIVRSSGHVQFVAGVATGSGITSARPATTVVGTQWYDASLTPPRPIWWSGSNWRDAAGTIV